MIDLYVRCYGRGALSLRYLCWRKGIRLSSDVKRLLWRTHTHEGVVYPYVRQAGDCGPQVKKDIVANRDILRKMINYYRCDASPKSWPVPMEAAVRYLTELDTYGWSPNVFVAEVLPEDDKDRHFMGRMLCRDYKGVLRTYPFYCDEEGKRGSLATIAYAACTRE